MIRDEAIRAFIEDSRRRHYESEDCWYSCPKSDDGCCDSRQGDVCNCGAEAWNARVDAMLEALSLRPAFMWREIETAPKDGTRILLVCGPEYEVARWSKPEGCWIGVDRALYPNAATFWQPLPAPPDGEMK